tara:strand:- start:391 stop:702 length:312 start_codon:yes stop_codon:yes gene_type:complete
MYLWKLFTTTQSGKRVSTLFESLTDKRSDALSEASARYGTSNLHIVPEHSKSNFGSTIIQGVGGSEPVWTVLGIIMVMTLYYWWGLIVPLVAWWGFKKWIGVD